MATALMRAVGTEGNVAVGDNAPAYSPPPQQASGAAPSALMIASGVRDQPNNASSTAPVPSFTLQKQQSIHHGQNTLAIQGQCYVHTEVTVLGVEESTHTYAVQGRVHFMWFHHAVHEGKILRQHGGDDFRGAALFHYLQSQSGFQIESLVAEGQGSVYLKPLNDRKCCTPVPSRKSNPVALIEGLAGEVVVESTIFYPDLAVVHLTYAYHGSIMQRMDLSRFPFDRQAIRIELLTRDNPPHSVFDPMRDGVGLAMSPTPPAHLVEVGAYMAQSSTEVLSSPPLVCSVAHSASGAWDLCPPTEKVGIVDFSKESTVRPVLFIPIQRRLGPYLVRIFLPMFVVVTAGFSALLLPPDELGNRALMVMIMLLSTIVFKFLLTNGASLTMHSVTTVLDQYLLWGTTSLALVLLCAVISHEIVRGTNETDKSSMESAVADARSLEVAFAAIFGIPWIVWHVAIVCLHRSNILRVAWVDIVARTMDVVAVTGIARVAPMMPHSHNGRAPATYGHQRYKSEPHRQRVVEPERYAQPGASATLMQVAEDKRTAEQSQPIGGLSALMAVANDRNPTINQPLGAIKEGDLSVSKVTNQGLGALRDPYDKNTLGSIGHSTVSSSSRSLDLGSTLSNPATPSGGLMQVSASLGNDVKPASPAGSLRPLDLGNAPATPSNGSGGLGGLMQVSASLGNDVKPTSPVGTLRPLSLGNVNTTATPSNSSGAGLGGLMQVSASMGNDVKST